MRADLPIVFKEDAELVLMDIRPVFIRGPVVLEYDALGVPNVELLVDGAHGAGQVGQEIACTVGIRTADAGKILGIENIHRDSQRASPELASESINAISGKRAWAKVHSRYGLLRAEGVRGAKARFDSTFERMFASVPTHRISVLPQRVHFSDSSTVLGAHHIGGEKRRPDNVGNS